MRQTPLFARNLALAILKIFYYSSTLRSYLNANETSIGFVPTMGALHAGHVSLVQAAKNKCELVVVSIFVNPLQFNNPEDLKKYPRTVAKDLELLKSAGVDAVYLAQESDLFHRELPETIEIGYLDTVFEGLNRPGHFHGVWRVLSCFFAIIEPDAVFFGLKDLQQCLVVEKLIQTKFPDIKQYNCPTLREMDGLAMSSRNMRLGPQGRKIAPIIYKELKAIAELSGGWSDALKSALVHLEASGIHTEYLSLVNLPEMIQTRQRDPKKRQALVFAGVLEGVRLIDNLVLPLTP